MSTYLVFYAGLLHSEYNTWKEFRETLLNLPDGCFIYFTDDWINEYPNGAWYRKDLTPVYKDDVPNELKASLLLMGITT